MSPGRIQIIGGKARELARAFAAELDGMEVPERISRPNAAELAELEEAAPGLTPLEIDAFRTHYMAELLHALLED